jgi:4-hydroxy-2-oxoglutarate aldolase
MPDALDRGVLAPISTPFSASGDLDLDALRCNIAKYNVSGLTGYVVAGSTGEAALLEKEERLGLLAAVREAAAAGMLLVAGTGAESVRETVNLSNAAADLGYDVALVLTPHYYRGQMARPETQAGFFQAVADGSRIPILVYNIPQVTGIDLPASMVHGLASHQNIIGVKESSGDLEKIKSMTCGAPAGFAVFVGSSAKYHDSLCLGANGGILAIANALPYSTVAIHRRFRAGDVEGSSQAQKRIFAAAGVAPKYGLQGLKYAMDLRGFRGGLPRPPLGPLEAHERPEVEALFQGIDDTLI